MASAPTDAIARVLSKNGTAVGAAFLVTERRLVTCAHVVADADASPGDIIVVMFHKTGRNLRARIMRDGWAAPNKEDVALLQLLDDEPSPAVDAVRFASSAFARGSVDTFSFPKLNNREGLAGRCEIIGTTTLDEYPVLQVRAPEVVPGYSGAPAWIKDSGFVVGMVVSRSFLDLSYSVNNGTQHS